MSAPLLDVAGLAYRYPGTATDRRVEVHLPALRLMPGEAVALVGPSGCGKSTLLDLLGLVLAPTAVARFALHGENGPEDLTARLGGGDLDRLAPVRRRLGYVLQHGGLLPFLTVADNIGVLNPDRAEVARLAARLGLEGLLHRYPGALSVGQRQRVSLARALCGRPLVLLADEPTAALDPPTAAEVLDLLVETVAERGIAMVLASHDWPLVESRAIPRLAAAVTLEGAPAPAPRMVARFEREAA